MSTSLPIQFREYIPSSDTNFILKTYLRGGKLGVFGKTVPDILWFNGAADMCLNHLLKSEKVILAVDINYPSLIFGFLIYNKIDNVFVSHFVYVKEAFRSIGIAKALYAEAGHDIKNPNISGITTYKHANISPLHGFHNLIYNPLLLCKGVNEPSKDAGDSNG